MGTFFSGCFVILETFCFATFGDWRTEMFMFDGALLIINFRSMAIYRKVRFQYSFSGYGSHL